MILDLKLTLFSTFFLHRPKHKPYIIISFNQHIVSDARDTSAGRSNTLITGSKTSTASASTGLKSHPIYPPRG